MKQLFLSIPIACFILCGCAGVRLYKDEAFTKRTGLKFYYPKPYLLVEKNGAKDVPLKTTLLFLPDLPNPVYAKVTKGLGSNAFSIALTNGALSAYGVTTDSKIPETITAAGGWLTGVAALKPPVTDVQQAASVKDLKEVQKIVDEAKSDIADNAMMFPEFITSNQKHNWTSAKAEIINTKKLVDALDPTMVKQIVESINKVLELLNAVLCKQETDQCKNFNGKIMSLVDQLTKAKEVLQPKEPNQPSFELYEIILKGNEVSYKLVTPTVEK